MANILHIVLAISVLSGIIQAKTTLVSYKETELQLQHDGIEAVNSVLFGLAGYIYKTFHGSHGSSDLTFAEIHPELAYQQGAPHITFVPPREVRMSYPKYCFCMDYSAIVIYNWFFFSMSTYTTFTTCSACNITIAFNNASDASPAVNTKIANKYTTFNVKTTSLLAKIIGMDKIISESVTSSNAWSEYIETAAQTIWKTITGEMINMAYSKYKVDIGYDAGVVSHSIPYMNAEIKNGQILDISYGYRTSTENEEAKIADGPDFAFEKDFNVELLSILYTKAMSLKWVAKINPATIPSNLTVKLDTKTFEQVIPDLIMREPPQNFSIDIYPNASTVVIKYQKETRQFGVTGSTLTVVVNDMKGKEIVKGTFTITFFLDMSLKCNNFTARIVPVAKRIIVEVLTLRSNEYETVIKEGMASVIQALIDEYYGPFFVSRTLGSGISLTTFTQKPDPEQSALMYTPDTISALIYYRRA